MSDLVATITQVRGTPTSEGVARDHRVLIDRPAPKGGLDQGPMGGELLLVALGGCFMSNLVAAAGARSIPVEVRGAAIGADVLDKLVTIAERGCIVHNTLAPAVKLTVRRA